MNRRENYVLSGIERRQGRASASARFAELDRMAQTAVAVPFATAGDALTFLRLVVGHAFKRLTATDTRHQTKAFFGMLASGQDFRGLARSMAAAEQLFAKRPANEDHANDGDAG